MISKHAHPATLAGENDLAMQQLLADSAFEAVGIFDENLRCILVNKEATNLLGYSRKEFLGISPFDLLAEESHSVVADNIQKGRNHTYHVRGKRKDGSTFPAEVRGRTVTLKGRKLRVTAMRDVTEAHEVQTTLASALNELEIIFATSRVGLMLLQGGRHLKRANKTLADILGYPSPEAMNGISMRELHLSEERYKDFGERFFSSLSDGAQLHVEYQLRKKDGSPLWCSLSGQAVDTATPADLDKGVLWVVDDISKRKTEEMLLVKQATTDDLTGALNRREFFRLANRVIEHDQRSTAGPSVLMADLDHFKRVNDKFGHEAGDKVLRSFSTICRGMLRDEDLLCRFGGEEFVVFLPGTNLAGAIATAERLRSQFASKGTATAAGNVQCTVSIGIAGTTFPQTPLTDLLRRADQALYNAKQAGRNQTVFYD